MGKFAQRRIVRKLDLELFLSKVNPQPSPKAQLEQYTLSEQTAANILHLAAYTNGDIIGRSVLDLGCGTGRLALGAAYLGAKEVVGVDVDKLAVKTAYANGKQTGFSAVVQWVLGDIGAMNGCFDTVLQNPPFGVQRRGADRAFVMKAIEVGEAVYSLHNHPKFDPRLIKQLKASNGFLQVQPEPFLESFVEKHGGTIKAVYAMLMVIPRMFAFHSQQRHEFVVDLYVIKKH
ncbi:MAG: METTL5 family protein [Candidatus Bathyarchaeota archaeon]|nr:METTL5 family protein [Candidatus Bathyarchaeota archaeon]